MTKFLLVLAFLVVMAAGAVVGMAVDRQLRQTAPIAESRHSHNSGPRPPPLAPDQQAKMKVIWGAVDKQRNLQHDLWRTLDKQRKEETQALLTPKQKDDWEAIQERYRAESQKLEDDVQKSLRKAEEDTLAMLTPEQQRQWKAWRDSAGPRRGGGPGRGGPGRGGIPRGGRDRSRPTTMPTTAPANSLTNAS